jgi:hypothetical protein
LPQGGLVVWRTMVGGCDAGNTRMDFSSVSPPGEWHGGLYSDFRHSI